ncbi:Sec63 Brl domain-containing protein [Fennellomyces sp. T-0311]|nr:Sec63 Brl domain-containing protein [Fennellomyces sp. T-0311]
MTSQFMGEELSENFDVHADDENYRIDCWLDQEEALLDGPEPAIPERSPLSVKSSNTYPSNRSSNSNFPGSGALQDIDNASKRFLIVSKPVSHTELPSQRRQHLQNSQQHVTPQGTYHAPAVGNAPLRSAEEIPMPYRTIFRFDRFNAMQSGCIDQIFHGTENIAVSAPTGAGKTVILELAMLRTLIDGSNTSKIIYMAPTKSLCSERVKDWEAKFQPLGISCKCLAPGKEYTGDTDFMLINSIKDSNIIVTTPEKWDSMTRRWTDYKSLMKLITLFVMDEVHILNERRGAVLEACVSRMKTMEHTVRYVAVSATVPNLQDIADWLGGIAISFSEEFRPVHLEQIVYGIPFSGDNMFSFESKLDWKLLEMVEKHSNRKPTLIFCSTRKSAQSSCEVMLKMMDKKNIASLGTAGMAIETANVKNKKLAEYLARGIGFHHGKYTYCCYGYQILTISFYITLAGLDSSDRQLVEQLFLQRKIRVVSTTSTLALGVNLPAHLVIIKSTKCYQSGALVDYSDIELLQMIGRAGRPGLEDSGCAVILTTSDMERRYQTILCGTTPIESCLHQNLVEHMMTEICLATVTDIESSIQWLKSTFLYTRIQKNPTRYRLHDDPSDAQRPVPEKVLRDICETCISTLTANDLAESTPTGRGSNQITATAYGTAMDRYYIKLGTMITILKAERCSSIKDVLSLVSKAEEFEFMRFTTGEKPFLNAIQKNANIRFPISGKVATIADKVFLVIQCVLGDISLHGGNMGSSLALSTFQMLQYACRVAKCIIDCSVYDHNAIRLKHTLDLYRSLQAKMWTTSSYPLRQIDKIGPQMAKKLGEAGIRSFDQLRETDAGRIEVILHRNPPFGNQIKDAVNAVPQFVLNVQRMSNNNPTQVTLKIQVGVSNVKKIPRKRYGKGTYALVWVEGGDALLDFRRISLSKLQAKTQSFLVRATLPDPSTQVTCYAQSEDYIGTDVSQTMLVELDPAAFTASLTPSMEEEPNEEPYSLNIGSPPPSSNGAHDDVQSASLTKVPGTQHKRKNTTNSQQGNRKKQRVTECNHSCRDKSRHACCKISTATDSQEVIRLELFRSNSPVGQPDDVNETNHDTVDNIETSQDVPEERPSSSTPGDYFDDDDDWELLAVQAVDDAETALLAKQQVSAKPSADEEDHCEKLWDDVGKFMYQAFNESFEEQQGLAPTTPKVKNDEYNTSPKYRLRRWLDKYCVIVEDD